MKRLWVRLGLMIGGVLFLVFFLQFLAITLDANHPEPPGEGAFPARADEIQRRLLQFMGLSLVVGLGGGAVIAGVVSAPVSRLTQAVRQIGRGDLSARVPEKGSQELRELAQTFNKMAADLQRAEMLRNQLMADVSHELRTPLTVLEGNLRAVLDHIYVLDEAEIANLYGQTRHLIRLVNDLRELALAEAGQLLLEKSVIDLQPWLAELLQALAPLAVEKNIELGERVEPGLQVLADPLRLQQVLFNLLSNALRHTSPGGNIWVSAARVGDAVLLTVEDDGDGLDAADLQAVFDRFYRADKSRSRETGGSGLGLAIVKAIVQTHGGQVQVRSPGRGLGSQFVVELPGGL